MDNLNLVLKFRLAGDPAPRVKGAARIKVDGRGRLTMYDAQSGIAESVDLRALQAFSIHTVHCSRPEIPILAVA